MQLRIASVCRAFPAAPITFMQRSAASCNGSHPAARPSQLRPRPVACSCSGWGEFKPSSRNVLKRDGAKSLLGALSALIAYMSGEPRDDIVGRAERPQKFVWGDLRVRGWNPNTGEREVWDMINGPETWTAHGRGCKVQLGKAEDEETLDCSVSDTDSGVLGTTTSLHSSLNPSDPRDELPARLKALGMQERTHRHFCNADLGATRAVLSLSVDHIVPVATLMRAPEQSLRTECLKRGLDAGGERADLVTRLQRSMIARAVQDLPDWVRGAADDTQTSASSSSAVPDAAPCGAAEEELEVVLARLAEAEARQLLATVFAEAAVHVANEAVMQVASLQAQAAAARASALPLAPPASGEEIEVGSL